MKLDPDKLLEDSVSTMHGEVTKLKKKAKTTDLTHYEVQILERSAFTAIRVMEHNFDEGQVVQKHLAKLSDQEWDQMLSGSRR